MKDSMTQMREQPVGKLMLSLGIPMIISMMLQALYNIVDSAFVANMEHGEAALNALTLAFPVQMLMVAIAIGTGVGANALLAKTLGEKNHEKAVKVTGNAIFLGVVISILFFLFGLFGVRPYIASQSSNPEIVSMAVEYLRICCLISVGIVFFSIFEKLLQATGQSLYSTIAQISGAVANIILDPILIYGWLGLPKMGIVGAAYATVIGQLLSFALAFLFHWKKNRSLCSIKAVWMVEGSIIGEIYAIGVPAILAQALMSVMTYSINLIFVRVDEALVTAYGLYYKIQQFILFAAFGLRDAITPVTAFSYGMRSRGRIKESIRFGLLDTSVIMLIGMAGLILFAEPFAALFGLSGLTHRLCVEALRIVSIGFLFAGVNVALQGVFQALDSGLASLIVSLLRQCLLVLPLAYLFCGMVDPQLQQTWMVWLAFPISEAVSALVAVLFMIRIHHKRIRPMK